MLTVVGAFGAWVYHRDATLETRLKHGDDHTYEILLKALESNHHNCAVEIAADGTIVWSNNLFVETFGLVEGDHLDEMIPREYRDKHNSTLRDAIKAHRKGGEGTYRDTIVFAIDAKGDKIQVGLRAWTTETGAMAFLRVMEGTP